MRTYDDITALAPTPGPLEREWSEATLHAILADGAASEPDARPGTTRASWWRSSRSRVAALVATAAVAVSAGTAVAGEGPVHVVRDLLLSFGSQPRTTANGLDELDDPRLVAEFQTRRGFFAVWVATSSNGTVCTALADGTWDGAGEPAPADLEYGCAEMVLAHGEPDRVVEITQPDQIGGFFKDDPDGPMVYGVSPYPEAAAVRLRGTGVRRVLPVRSDSGGFGAALPEASRAASLQLTWVDDEGRVLGSEQWVAPVG